MCVSTVVTTIDLDIDLQTTFLPAIYFNSVEIHENYKRRTLEGLLFSSGWK